MPTSPLPQRLRGCTPTPLRRGPGAGLGGAVLLGLSAVAPGPAQGQPVPTWSLDPAPIVEVGGDEGGPGLLFHRIVGAVALADGRLVVADGGDSRLVLLTEVGEVEVVVGREGEGPGEFRSISGLWAGAAGGFSVWDSRLRRVTHFGADGSLVSTYPVTFGPEGSPVTGGSLDAGFGGLPDGRFVVAWVVATGRGGAAGPPTNRPLPDLMIYGLFDAQGRFDRILARDEGMVRYYPDGGGGGPLPLSPFPWRAVVGDTLVTTNGSDGVLRFFAAGAPGEGGGADATAGMPDRLLTLPGEPLSNREAFAVLERAAAGGELSEMARGLLERTDRNAAPVPLLGRMFADDQGRLWLKDYDPGTDALILGGGPHRTGGRWTVRDTGGNALATLVLPESLSPLAVVGDRLLALARDDFGVERFVVHRLRGP